VHLTILYIVVATEMVATTLCIWQPALGGTSSSRGAG